MRGEYPKQKYLQRFLKQGNWYHSVFFFFLFTVFTVIFLYLFQYVVASEMIQPDNVLKYIFMDYKSPNLSSLFLSNYIHKPQSPEHIRENVLSFAIISILIGILYLIIFPRYKIKMPDHFLAFVYSLIFLAVPLSISGVSYVFMKIGAYDENIRYSLGFSGIVWALVGFLFFLAAVFLTRVLYVSYSGAVNSRRQYFSLYFFFIFVISVLILLPVFLIIADMDTTINLYAHLAGFTYGWLVPPVLGFYLLSSGKLMKSLNFALIIFLLILPFLVAESLLIF